MKNKKIRRRIRAVLLAVVVICLVLIGREYALSARHKAQKEALLEQLKRAENERENGKPAKELLKGGQESEKADGDLADSAAEGKDAEEVRMGEDKVAVLEEYAGLYEENEDMAGWLSVEGTKIDYPVMQGEDDEYYLHHDFYGQESKYGCLYVRNRADIDKGTNFVVYGHNMKDGSMFGELDLYLEEGFYREHPLIRFDSLFEKRTYEIIAVFRSQVYDQAEDVFRYYQFYEADTEEEFDDFYENIKALSLYDTGVEAQFGDQFITLSTCAYHVEDGRFVVVAKRQKEERK